MYTCTVIGWAWASPTLIVHDSSPCMYVCIIKSTFNVLLVAIRYLTFSPVFVAPCRFPRSVYVLKYSVYSGILTCSNAWFTTEQQGQPDALIVYCENYQRRQLGECTDSVYKWIQPTETVELYSYLATCQRSICVNQKRLMGWLYSVLFCDVHIDMGVTLNCLHVICGCRAIQTNSAETSLTLLAY